MLTKFTMNVNQWLNINQLFVIITFLRREKLYYNLDDKPFCNNYIFSVVVVGGGGVKRGIGAGREFAILIGIFFL